LILPTVSPDGDEWTHTPVLRLHLCINLPSSFFIKKKKNKKKKKTFFFFKKENDEILWPSIFQNVSRAAYFSLSETIYHTISHRILSACFLSFFSKAIEIRHTFSLRRLPNNCAYINKNQKYIVYFSESESFKSSAFFLLPAKEKI
jgi:hypothetical protein